ncbi:MAG TPA: nucleotidyltransferase family protein [Candidatus Acidoferrales bacterium]|nr:nucleotidyltransferase family protein [Candidatus Acidoferrales bacterium]
MSPTIATHRKELEALCRRFSVRRLEVFGSAAAGNDRPGESDIDFLVEFGEFAPGAYADAYFGLLESLQDLFGCPVDLVVPSAIRNPYLAQAIERSRALVYAA